jgi:hypothetical protein
MFMAIESLAMQIEVIPGYFVPVWILLIVSLWEIAWTGTAMWIAARKRNVLFFVAFLVIQMLGIPEIVYFIISRRNDKLSIIPRNSGKIAKKKLRRK